MDKSIVVKKVVQGIAVCYGVLGVGMIVAGILFIIPTAKENIWATLFIIPGLMPGVLLLLAAYQNIKRFGVKSIRSFSAILALTVSILGTTWLMPFIRSIPLSSERYDVISFILLPVVIGLIVYSIFYKQLIKLTESDK
jgi:hypothetical protein